MGTFTKIRGFGVPMIDRGLAGGQMVIPDAKATVGWVYNPAKGTENATTEPTTVATT